MKKEEIISIVIADDHPIFRDGLKARIGTEASLNVVGEASTGPEAISLIEKLRPKVAVLDIDMPGCNGIEVVQSLREKKIPVEIIILTMYSDEEIFDEVMNLGVKGFVLKDNAANDLLTAIKSVAGGKHYITPSISGFLIKRNEKSELAKNVLKNITAMERRVLSLIAENKTSKEIAEELFISYKTVENHRTNICSKLNLRGSHALLKFVFDNKDMILS